MLNRNDADARKRQISQVSSANKNARLAINCKSIMYDFYIDPTVRFWYPMCSLFCISNQGGSWKYVRFGKRSGHGVRLGLIRTGSYWMRQRCSFVPAAGQLSVSGGTVMAPSWQGRAQIIWSHIGDRCCNCSQKIYKGTTFSAYGYNTNDCI